MLESSRLLSEGTLFFGVLSVGMAETLPAWSEEQIVSYNILNAVANAAASLLLGVLSGLLYYLLVKRQKKSWHSVAIGVVVFLLALGFLVTVEIIDNRTPTPVPSTLSPTSANTPSKPEGYIAFCSDRDIRSSGHQILVMTPDGKILGQLTEGRGENHARSWSRDGSFLMFASVRDNNWEVYFMDSDGSNQRSVSKNYAANDYDPILSPDGRWVAFTSNRDGNAEIYRMSIYGTEIQRLTNNPAKDRVSSWSPDGKFIAFYSDRDGSWQIYIMDVEGANQQNLSKYSVDDDIPVWTPHGESLVFRRYQDGNTEIYIMNSDGSNQRNLSNNPAHDDFPTVSPDGQFVAFSSIRDGNREIYIMNIDGTNQRRITFHPAEDTEPLWSKR